MSRELLLNDLMDVFRGLKKLMHNRVALQNLSMTHFIALRFLMKRGPSSMGELAECLSLTQGAITGVVDRLEGRGLVERMHSPKDRRTVQVALTEAGQALQLEIFSTSRREFEKVLQFLDENEQAEVAKALGLLSKALKRYEGSDERIAHAGK